MPKKILVVDDEPDIRKLLAFRLKTAGYEVLVASEGRGCLKKAEEERPDLIVLDVIMPGVNGFEICHQLKENQKTKNIPVIMLTVLAHEMDLDKGLEHGANAFISKPFNIIDLLWEINALLPGAKKRKNEAKAPRKRKK